MQEQERKHREYRHRTCISQPGYPLPPAYCQHPLSHCQTLRHSEPSGTDSSASIDVLLGNLSLRASLRSDLLAADNAAVYQSDYPHVYCPTIAQQNFPVPGDYSKPVQTQTDDDHSVQRLNMKMHTNAQGDGVNVGQQTEESPAYVDQTARQGKGDCKRNTTDMMNEQEIGEKTLAEKHVRLPDYDLRAVERPIENEEWIVFLQRSMEEIMEGEVDSLLQQSCVSIFVSPLRNPAAGCQVIEYVACLLSLPFTVSVSKENLQKIERVYLDVRVVPNLVYAVKLLMLERPDSELNAADRNTYARSASSLSADELQALECTMLVLCRLVHAEDQFLMQFCDAIYIVNGMTFLEELLALEKRKARVVADLVAILNNILRSQPENAELVEHVVLRKKEPG